MATTTINVYKSYSFKDKDPAIDQLRTVKKDVGMSDKEISEQSGVSIGTLRGWFNKGTRRPQHATIMAVARAMGYDYKLVKAGRKK